MSKVDLAIHGCAFSFRNDAPVSNRPPRISGVKGTNIHSACESFVNDTPMPELTKDEARNWASLRGWLSTEEPYSGMEFPLLYDASNDTAAECEMGESKRDYLGVSPMTIPGTVDLYRYSPGSGIVTVLEVKTGAHGNVEKEPANLQLASQALALARLFRVDRARVGVVFTRMTKVRPPNWHELGALHLDEHAGKIHRVLKMLPEAQPVKGDWCWHHCDLGPSRNFKATCPAWATEEKESA